ncbi:hypothetical protein CFE70_004922 [Pyrenophora teres f. teres 0-1]|uniref:geranylgeranyl diphosphate synthase n=2 Tax=Pyrenophora teres f. teres TaxID=97479 RepID=E3RJF9_PYRTT|nr:hypothetical protein PTT_08283 [Pyrenophora teres f. teres 0-1]KAE8840359.1 hypothetical protein PTNB85_03758 [Pyrenophora teres f. teres]KAE8849501.1 hypothetical protein HRS9122_03517 [Pyrenophora teres f. teres]KAE8863858.1 hypothetical protein PTNB29_03822 [Pyrenophora teres f. teres]KAE8866656.1 hypothetical protein PTNB73_04750 [Pyrenophora teres f. teres]
MQTPPDYKFLASLEETGSPLDDLASFYAAGNWLYSVGGQIKPLPTPPKNPKCILQETTALGSRASRDIWHPACSASVPPDPHRLSTESLDFTEGIRWCPEKEKAIKNPFEYIASQPGKEFRTRVLEAFNEWLQISDESLKVIANVVRTLHTASLLIDDIQDSSVLRRGRPVAHRVYGVAQTINSANYHYFLALQELRKLDNQTEALMIYETEMLRLHQGQGMELYWRDTSTCPTEDDYLEMVSNKTRGLFRLAIRLMQSRSSSRMDCIPLVQLLGLIFQIVDDYKNLSDVDYTQAKGACEDITEGKFSFPVIHSIRSDPTNFQLLSILAQKPTDMDIKMSAMECIERTKSLEYTRTVVAALVARAHQVVDEMDQGQGQSRGIHAVLNKLSLERR